MREPAAPEKSQVNSFLRVGMGDFFDEFEHLHLAAKFLVQFTAKALLESFTRLTFATGKFP